MGRGSSTVPAGRRMAAGLAAAQLFWPLLLWSGLVGLGVVTTSCGSSGSSGASATGIASNAELVALHQGRLVDVYGLVTRSGQALVQLFQEDVLIGPDIRDERETGSSIPDAGILYDFIGANPDTLQQRLLITREIGSNAFQEAFERLDDNCRVIAPLTFGADTRVQPYSVMPRNAALRLTFSEPLGIDDSFFYERDPRGRVLAVKNTEAVQLLRIAGDPTNTDPNGDFEVMNTRTVVRGNQITIDPVLLGTEGLQYGAKNQASGLPESPDQAGANIRVAVALDGPLAIRGVRAKAVGGLTGLNNSNFRSIVRDFRSGNTLDNSADLARGFVRDPLPPRVLGQMRMYLQQVDDRDGVTKVLTIFKNDIAHDIDRGDVVRIIDPANGETIASLEILTEPVEDNGEPAVQRVSVVVRRLEAGSADVLESYDPSARSDFPKVAGAEQDAWLRANAPLAILLAEFTADRVDPKDPSKRYGDDPSYFITFSPTPEQEAGSAARPNQDVSPTAGAIVRFTKPIDLATVRALDSLFIATRDVLTKSTLEDFLNAKSMNPGLATDPAFLAKFRTPHLVFSRVFDEDGSQTAIRIKPTLGLYLDEAMRTAIEADKKAKPFHQWRFNYFVHVAGGAEGIRDLAGNTLDFQSDSAVVDALVMPFSLDSRKNAAGQNRQGDNIVAYVVRRFATDDEDERPNLYITNERPPKSGNLTVESFPRSDMVGPVAYLSDSGELLARTPARITKVADNLNQLPPPPQGTPLSWCPPGTQVQPTAAIVFGQPLQNPLNPFGCRLQTVWREVDYSLSRTDTDDLNLDVEQMYWAPFSRGNITFDEFDQITLYLGHSEFRPEACTAGQGFPQQSASGLRTEFARNYGFNQSANNQIELAPAPHPAFVDQILTINPKEAITEPNGVNRYLPLPPFEDATKKGFADRYFVWRDETGLIQGGVNGLTLAPYIASPFAGGLGNPVGVNNGNPVFNIGRWYNGNNRSLSGGANDNITGGLLLPVALPLLADFWVYPDSPDLPKEDPFRASGANGWQVSLALTVAPTPNFRVFSAGFGGGSGSPTYVSPSQTPSKWAFASGGFTPAGGTVQAADNTNYWMMTDFLKRTTIATSGFVEILDPHRMAGSDNTGAAFDPRLGPYTPVAGHLPDYAFDFEPSLDSLPAGTAVIPEFRAAGPVDTTTGYPWSELQVGGNPTTPANFPLDPGKAGDAQIRHYDDRLVNGVARRSWTHLYNRNLTEYTRSINDLADTNFTNKFGGPNESFEGKDVKYFNWRFIMRNNVEADPPVAPRVQSFSVSYRFIRR